MHQGLLFPNGFEILEQALVALKDIDVRRAEGLVRRARAAQPNLVNLDVIEEACDYLREKLPALPQPDQCAATLLAVPWDVEAARLREEVGHFVDQVVSRYLASLERDGPFVDRSSTVPWARVLLLLGQPHSAYRSLVELVARQPRADLWWALGDAALLVDRATEANAAFVRALVLDPRAIDCFRLQCAALLRCYGQLREQHDPPNARELLLPIAWIDGTLEITPGNRWLDVASKTFWTELPDADGPSATRNIRQFSRLMFADRTAGSNNVDIARREKMAALAPELFHRYIVECQRREAP